MSTEGDRVLAETNVMAMNIHRLRLQSRKEGQLEATEAIIRLVRNEFDDSKRWLKISEELLTTEDCIVDGAKQFGDRLVGILETVFEINERTPAEDL